MGKALLEIKDLKARLQQAEQLGSNEAVAVIGMACRFPGGANSPAQFWELLKNGVDAIGEVPPGRWDTDRLCDPDRSAPGKMVTARGGFIDDLAGFDAAFFGISPREAESLDPHQRILLEVCREALEDAQFVPEHLFGGNCGVFVGVSSMDNVIRLMGADALEEIGAYHGTGCALAPIAGRVSYTFGFNGPSFVVDTACSSSLLSLHLAAASLRRRECDLALGGGVHFIFHPGYSVAFSKANMLAADGRCKTFDASADGYVRGEGCGMLVLKRLADAQRDGDLILALLHGSAVNQDGASGGLTVPSGPSQEQVIRQALKNAGLPPEAIDYIEAHGTGTSLGDPIEIGALGNVFGKRRLRVGSVKTNIGHLEASAGIASAIKVILALRHGAIPPHLNLKTPNPLIPWAETGVEVPTQLAPWTPSSNGGRERIAGISSFGFSGTNVHMIFGEAPAVPAVESAAVAGPQLLCLSARNDETLRALAQRWVAGPLARDDAPLADLCAGALALRHAFPQRLAIVAADAAAARTWLTDFAAAGNGMAATPGGQRVAFLFTGQGSQYAGMGRALYEAEPVFRQAIDACDALLTPELGRSLRDLLFEDDGTGAIDATGNTQPALFALEYALAQLWQSWGVQPAALLGHSVGEYVAAVLAGVFSLADGARLLAARARLMQALPAGGAMAAVLAPFDRVEATLAQLGPASVQLSVAATNGPRNTVVSGAAAALDALVAGLVAQGVECRRLTVSHAFHSPLMEPMLEDFRAVAATITYAQAALPVVSNLTGRVAGPEIATTDYWVRHVRQAVRFAEGVRELAALGCTLLLEAGPAATLTAMARQVDDSLAGVPSLRRGEDAQRCVLAAAGELWCRGVEFAPPQRGRVRRELPLPTYPFRHRDYWKPVDVEHAGKTALHGLTQPGHPLLATRFASPLLRETLFETVFSKAATPFVEDHRVFGQLVVSGASHLSLVLAAGREVAGAPCSLAEVLFPQALAVPEEGACAVQLALGPLPAKFRLIGVDAAGRESALHARGRIALAPPPPARDDLAAARAACSEELPVAAVYALQKQRHIVLGPSYRWLVELRRGAGQALARLAAPAGLEAVVGRFGLHPGLIDSCFGTLVMAGSVEVSESFIPFGVAALHCYRIPGNEALVAHATVRAQDAQRLVGDIRLCDAAGNPVADFIGLEGRQASRQALLRQEGAAAPAAPAIYGIAWESLPAVARPPAGRWLVFLDEAGSGTALVAGLRGLGVAAFAVRQAEAGGLQVLGERDFALAPQDLDGFAALLAECGALDQVLYLWGMTPAGDYDAAERASLGALHLVQALASAKVDAGGTPCGRLWFVTRGAQAVAASDRVPAPEQALLWGLTRAVVAEHGEMNCTCLDLDADGDNAAALTALLHASCVPAGESRIAWRGGVGHVARLDRLEPASTPAALPTSGCCLITGAGGALGQALARWLAGKGVRQIALLSRRPASADFLAELAAIGTSAQSYAVDVADAAALEAALDRIESAQGQIGSVFHLAAVLDDGPIIGQTAARCTAVLAPKARGAWNLQQALTRRGRTPLFVNFASVAGLLDGAGQAAYAAANACLDALAQQRRAQGGAAFSIDWGPWDEIGMAARLAPEQRARFAAQGIGSLAPAWAFSLLEQILGGTSTSAQVAVLAMEWAQVAATQRTPFLARVAEPAAAAEGDNLRAVLAAAAPRERRELLAAALVDLVAKVLRLPRGEVGPRERLFDLGVDSLLAIELKKRLEAALDLRLSPTLLFDYPSVDALTRYLLDEALAELKSATASEEDTTLAEVAALSEDEAEAALLAQLQALEKDME
jgi:acyl transferase domain-containing protein/acyl carrier protein